MNKKQFAVYFGCSPFKTGAPAAPMMIGLAIPFLILTLVAVCALADPGTSVAVLAGAGAVGAAGAGGNGGNIPTLSAEDFDKLDKLMKENTDTWKAKMAAISEGNEVKAKELHEKAEKMEAEVAKSFEDLRTKQIEASDRLSALEQKGIVGPSVDPAKETIGQALVESDQYKSMIERGDRSSGQIKIGSFFDRAQAVIVNPTGQNQPLVQSMRVPGIIGPGLRRLTIRNLIPVGPTQSNLVEFVRENVFTDSAAPTFLDSPGGTDSFENVEKAESNITFTLASEAVQTIAHWIRASKQILADAGMLRSYVDSRMMFGLQQEEEDQLLLGDNTGANLNGLVTQATAYDAALDVANDTAIDKLRHAILQVALSEFVADGIVLHPTQWHTIELVKVNPGTDDRYVWANPAGVLAPRIWGLPVVETTAMTAGDFLVGAFAMAAQIWDRENATIEASREDRDNFIKNMVTILAEERIALTVYRTAALVTGTF